MADTQTEQGSPFWRFSLRFYRRPGVADACIALQDGCGVDVNILLFLLWLALARRCVPSAAGLAVCARVAPWRGGFVVTVRQSCAMLTGESCVVSRSPRYIIHT